MSNGRPQIDVCVATYKRPQLLATLLESLIAQETRGQFLIRILVVDNDLRRSAEAVVRKIATGGVKIVYDVEPEQSISLARNRGFSQATGQYIATIDDDEYADREWLANLFNALTQHEADVAFGPATPIFQPDTPEYIRGCETFLHPNPPTGSTDDYVYHTANALLRRRVIEGTPTPFDPGLGLTGGEDTAFFDGLRLKGRKFVWCREARVFTVVPPERANLRWIAKREFRYGNACRRAQQPGPFAAGLSPRAEVARSLREIARVSLPLLLYLSASPFEAKYMIHVTKHLRRAAYMLGLCAYHLHFHYEEYRQR